MNESRSMGSAAQAVVARLRQSPLDLCRGCNRHISPDEAVCPHCGGDVASLALAHEKKLRAARAAMRRLLKYLPQS